jgi:hypothetical protein
MFHGTCRQVDPVPPAQTQLHVSPAAHSSARILLSSTPQPNAAHSTLLEYFEMVYQVSVCCACVVCCQKGSLDLGCAGCTQQADQLISS